MAYARCVTAFTLTAVLVHAGAQPIAAQTTLTSPKEIAHCLCLERTINDLRFQMDTERYAQDSEQLRLDILKEQIEQQRPHVNVDDPASVESFKALLDRLDAEQGRFQDEVSPRYADSVERYNKAVGAYDGPCRGKFFDGGVVAALSPNLNCPRP